MDLSDAFTRVLGANTLVYWPLWLLSTVMGPIAAGKWTVLLTMGCSVWALHALAGRLGRDPMHALVAGMLLFNVSLYWGFLNFISGLPLFLCFVGWGIPAADEKLHVRQGVLAAGLLFALYLAHVLWLPLAGAMVLIREVRARQIRQRFLPWLAIFLPVGVASAVWFLELLGARAQSGFRTGAIYAGPLLGRFTPSWIVNGLWGGLRGWLEILAASVVVLYASRALWEARGRGERASDKDLLWLSLLCLTFGILAPDLYANTMFFNVRFVSLGGLLLVLALPPVDARAVRVVGVIGAALFALGTTAVWVLFEQDELSGLPQAIERYDAPKRVVGLDFQKHSPLLLGRPFLQTFAYLQAVRGGEVSFSFAEHGSSIVAYRGRRLGDVTPGLEWEAERATRRDLEHFDCALVNGKSAEHDALLREAGFVTGQKEGNFRLYCRE